MRKLGLRALAGGLAVMMVASVFAPAQKANAADVLLIAPAPTAAASETTLYVTEDMVDEDGEIVISGGNYDRVVVSKEAAAKDIYFDQVTVGELVVESGSNSKIQLWEVDAEKVTVQEPELEELTIKDLLPLLSDPETQQTAINLYMENQAKNKKILNTAPSIVTKEDAKVDALVVRANATLDLKDGGVDEVALEASEKIDRAKVTLKNYNGDVSYKGGEAKNSMTLKNVDSRINKLTVEESNANNQLTVTAKNSVVLKAEVAGNAEVSLNAPMGTVEVTEAATAAKIFILGVTDEMIVAANDAQVEVAPCGSVTAASVTGNNVDVVGGGVLVEVDITGEGAYVSTTNTKVEGVNTYIPPEPYKEPVYDSWTEDFSDSTLVEGVATDGASMNWASYEYDAENGYGIAHTANGWEGFAIKLNNRDNGSDARFVISMKVKKLGGAATDVRFTENSDGWPEFGDRVTLEEDWISIVSNKISVPAGGARVIMIAPGNGATGITLDLAVDDIKVERYTDWTEPPARPKPTESVTYNFSEMTLGKNYGVTLNVVEGALHIDYAAQYQEADYKLPEGKWTDDFDRIKVDFESCTGSITFKVLSGGETVKEFYGKSADCILDLSDVDAYEVTDIGIMQDNKGTCEAVINGFTFVLAGEEVEVEMEAPKAPGELSEDYLVYDMATLVPDAELTDIGGLTLSFAQQYGQTNFTLPAAINVADYEKMIVTLSSATGAVAFKTYEGETETNAWYGKSATKTTDIEVSLSDVKNQESTISAFAIMSNEGACDVTVYRVAFVPKATQQEPSQPAGNIVYNFEDGIAMVSGNGATPAQAVPATTGNSIWKQISAGGYAAGTIATKLPDGKTLDEMTSVRFDYYIVTEGVQYKPVKVFIGSELENSEAVWNDACVNTPDISTCQDMTNGQTWGVCTTALDTAKVSALGLAAGADIKLGIGMMWEGATYYIDNVRLVDAEGNEYLLEDFEGAAPTFGVINYGVESSVDNTVDLSVYGESMVQVTNSSWGQGVKFGFTLPEGKTIADYKGLQMNVFLPADAVPVDGQDFTYKDLRVNAGTGDYVALPEGTEYIAWNSAGNVGSWVLVEVANWDTLAAAIGELTTFNIAVGVNTPCQTPYYIDNVTLVAK